MAEFTWVCDGDAHLIWPLSVLRASASVRYLGDASARTAPVVHPCNVSLYQCACVMDCARGQSPPPPSVTRLPDPVPVAGGAVGQRASTSFLVVGLKKAPLRDKTPRRWPPGVIHLGKVTKDMQPSDDDVHLRVTWDKAQTRRQQSPQFTKDVMIHPSTVSYSHAGCYSLIPLFDKWYVWLEFIEVLKPCISTITDLQRLGWQPRLGDAPSRDGDVIACAKTDDASASICAPFHLSG